MGLPFEFGAGIAAYLAVALVAAAFVRGYSGFGFSAIFVVLAALVVNPLPLIPVVFICEIAMTAFQARGIRAHIDWPRVLALLAGSAIAIVPAVTVMVRLGEDGARLAISVMVLALSLLLLSGWQLRRRIGHGGNFAVGVVSGVANSAGVGGLPVGAFLTAQPIAPAIFRATMIVFLTGLDLLSLPVMAANGLISGETALGVMFAFPLLGLGIWIGSRAFSGTSQEDFRRWVVILLSALSVLNILRALV